ncbi:MAG TPA: hypothetical protein PKO45_14785 [Rubrivivax sp.]|nr:hypothetical protein [Burkholderiales bacterium]HNT40378.1 hypothetical protein [Rubrivivax sp.]
MNERVTLRQSMPPVRELESTSGRVVQAGARPLPQTELSNQLPNLGPYRMGGTIYYELQVYPGPLLKMVGAPARTPALDTSA